MPESDKPLPLANWGEPVHLDPAQQRSMLLSQEEKSMLLTEDQEKHASEQIVRDSWRPSFAAIGYPDLETLERIWLGVYSNQLEKIIRTYEDMYQLMAGVNEQGERNYKATIAETLYDSEWQVRAAVQQDPQDSTLPLETDAVPGVVLGGQVEINRLAWKKAVEDRREAIQNWDKWVRFCHDQYHHAKSAQFEEKRAAKAAKISTE